jgi:hypothetical protein
MDRRSAERPSPIKLCDVAGEFAIGTSPETSTIDKTTALIMPRSYSINKLTD